MRGPNGVVGNDTFSGDNVGGNRLMIFEEGGFGNHHEIAKASKVGGILNFLGEDIAWVNLTWDMGDFIGA